MLLNPTTQEAGVRDTDGDGIVDDFVDIDANGRSDRLGTVALSLSDFDEDAIFDHLDVDSDNDGLPDVFESLGADFDRDGNGQIDSVIDLNGDGLADGININTVFDTDSDGYFNHLDLDSDGDNKFDLVEAGGTDNDNDGQVDAWLDSDADGIPDDIDVDQMFGADEDGDGIIDQADADTVNVPDTDGDGIVDSFDRDPFGTGYIRLGDEPLVAANLPDANANNIPDVFEHNIDDHRKRVVVHSTRSPPNSAGYSGQGKQ